MRSAAKTEWGQKIIKTLKDTVDSRRKFQLHVPLLEGGHIHDYFCPEHKVRFSFDWNKPEAHYCSQCIKLRLPCWLHFSGTIICNGFSSTGTTT